MDVMEKRKRVMARSIKLGHCVCDPRKPCPCPLLKEKNVCTCAGERVQSGKASGRVRLTDYVRSAGCASKIGQKDLHAVLAGLPVVQDPRILVGMATADDAGVFKLASGVTVVQTVDVFTPGVDDPYLFGRIAACNSLSDVYAMGGTPVTALSIIGFPIEKLPHAVMSDILRGGMDTLKEAGTILLGGHSINDEEIKFGFAVP
ncbi:MAG: selenide, water dikinase SelD, partial [bacterium]